MHDFFLAKSIPLAWHIAVDIGEGHAATSVATKVFEVLSNELAACFRFPSREQ